MKILIVGGAGQEKGEYAYNAYGVKLEDGGACGLKSACLSGGINRLHLLIKRMMKEGPGYSDMLLKGLLAREGWVIVCDEVGSGVVPLEAFEREWREAVGRFCCELAHDADLVVRLCCGVAMTLKGETL